MVHSNKKVCFITPSLQMGGMERVISILSNYAVREAFTIYIICLVNNESHYTIDDRVNIIAPDFKYKKGLINKARVAQFLLKTLKSIKPDAILSFSEAFNPLSIVVSKTAGYPIFISDRSSPEVQLKRTTQILRKTTYPLANGLILQTSFSKKIAESKRYNDNIAVIPNPLKVANQSTDTLRKNIIISVGRLIPSKNFGELIDIFSNIENKKSWELWILGKGPEKEYLNKKINNLNLSNKVKLLGSVKNVDEYLSQASIFAFTSLSEGFPNALSEALANPLPCVAYDCISGPADLIKHNHNGFLVTVGDKKPFKYYLEKLMDSSNLRQEMTADYASHINKYRVDKIAEMYLDFILN